jgi:hypothetical protein
MPSLATWPGWRGVPSLTGIGLPLPSGIGSLPWTDTEFRFKLYIPARALQAGHSAVAALATSTARAFRTILSSPDLEPFLTSEEA